jgi:hypothetical protein
VLPNHEERAELSCRATPRPDRGATFVELLVSIVLIGTAVVATLAAVRATIIGTSIERDHSRAQQWLQSAVGVIEREDFADCSSVTLDGPAIREAYLAAVTYDANTNPDGAKIPDGFDGGSIDVSEPLVWDGLAFVPFETQSQCYDDVLLRQQLITVTVTSPDGEVVESVDLIKRDRP